MEAISGLKLPDRLKDESMDEDFERVIEVRDFAIQANKSTAAYTNAFAQATGMKTPGAPRVVAYIGTASRIEEDWRNEAAESGIDPDKVCRGIHVLYRHRIYI